MERKYYGINEVQAKMAKQMMSFNDYVEGSKTKEYKQMVDKVYDLAEKIAKKRPDEAKRAEKLACKYSLQLATYFNQESRIGCMCPSVMISGAGNFPVKKKQKQNAAWERNYEFYNKTQGIIEKLNNILLMKEIIKADDEKAIEKLQKKLDKMVAEQEMMKKANAYYRKWKTMKGFDGVSDDTAKQMDEAIEKSMYQKPYEPWRLSNNNANIKRVKSRIANLEQVKSEGTKKEENEYFKVVENSEAMRLQLYFDEKPSAEVREVLKTNGFRFSPKNNNAWQRQLTNNARYACERVIKQLKEMEGADNE